MALTGILGWFIDAANIKQVSLIFGLFTLLFGVLVIWKPKILAYLLGIYFVIMGLTLLFGGIF